MTSQNYPPNLNTWLHPSSSNAKLFMYKQIHVNSCTLITPFQQKLDKNKQVMTFLLNWIAFSRCEHLRKDACITFASVHATQRGRRSGERSQQVGAERFQWKVTWKCDGTQRVSRYATLSLIKTSKII